MTQETVHGPVCYKGEKTMGYLTPYFFFLLSSSAAEKNVEDYLQDRLLQPIDSDPVLLAAEKRCAASIESSGCDSLHLYPVQHVFEASL